MVVDVVKDREVSFGHEGGGNLSTSLKISS